MMISKNTQNGYVMNIGKAVAIIAIVMIGALLQGCVSLSYQEKQNLVKLRENGITVDRPVGNFDEPNSRLAAGLLNLLPGIGNFYLACGRGSEGVQCVYGVVNILFWPMSIVWAAPQSAIDAGTLNEREMLYYYRYNKSGREALRSRGVELD